MFLFISFRLGILHRLKGPFLKAFSGKQSSTKLNFKTFFISSRVAQWKRAGPISQRSEDQNLALLVIVLLIKRMSEGVYFSSFYSVFSTNQIKEKRCNLWQARENARNKNIDRLYMGLPYSDYSDVLRPSFFPPSCHVDQFTFHILLPSLKFTISLLFTRLYMALSTCWCPSVNSF